MKYIVTSASVKSRCHTLNEDCCFTAPRFIIVADGMGGENCGEVASKIAVDVVASTLNDGLAGDLPYDSAVQLSRNAIMKATLLRGKCICLAPPAAPAANIIKFVF